MITLFLGHCRQKCRLWILKACVSNLCKLIMLVLWSALSRKRYGFMMLNVHQYIVIHLNPSLVSCDFNWLLQLVWFWCRKKGYLRQRWQLWAWSSCWPLPRQLCSLTEVRSLDHRYKSQKLLLLDLSYVAEIMLCASVFLIFQISNWNPFVLKSVCFQSFSGLCALILLIPTLWISFLSRYFPFYVIVSCYFRARFLIQGIKSTYL